MIDTNLVSVHHYLRSTKECMKEKGDGVLCNIKGEIEDSLAWERVQFTLPWYASFNGLL